MRAAGGIARDGQGRTSFDGRNHRARVGLLPRAWSGFLLAVLLGACVAGTRAAEETPPEPARLQLSGFGLLKNRTLRTSLLELLPEAKAPVFSARFVEDAFLVLRNQLVDEGFLESMVVCELVLTNGREMSIWWDGNQELEVPHELSAVSARFEAIRGVLFHYEELEFEGLTALPESRARGFFVAGDTLLNLKTARRYSTDHLQTSMRGLRQELMNRGYREATVRAQYQAIDRDTGAARITVAVKEGPRYSVGELTLRLPESGDLSGITPPPLAPDQPFSRAWEQDAAQAVNVQLYRLGYADARTEIVERGREAAATNVVLHLEAQVSPGEQVALGEVQFRGARYTRRSFLERRARLEGPLLDRVAADRARERLARYGNFRFVDLKLEPETGSPRNVVYELTEARRYDLNLIGGYGSYDQLFGGFEFEHFNLWGVGHNTRLKLLQSLKSTHGTYTYTVPEFLAPHLSLFGAVDGFRREELTFDRQELKLSVGVRKEFPRARQQMGLRYSYEFLDAQTAAVGDEATRAAAIIVDWNLDRRDNPLLPRKGYHFYANTEFADELFGGGSEYIRLEVGASYHHPFSRGLIAHLGLLHSVVTSPDPETLLPFNKRFFPGGENSVRGYQRGGASPVDANGEQLGAEAALQWNLELEQKLTRAFSVVAFLDGVGVTPAIESYPFDEVLWSVGAGVRWNSVIGPVRLEYGYNLDPRPTDPDGTLQFSIGFPF